MIRIAAIPITKGEGVMCRALVYYFILVYYLTFTVYYSPHLRGGEGVYNPNITPYATINPNMNP